MSLIPHQKRILAAVAAVTDEAGVSKPTDLQLITDQALIRMAGEDYEAVGNLFVAIVNNHDGETSRSQVRRFVKRLAHQAQSGALLAHFDNEIGYMGGMATDGSTSDIDNYVRGLYAISGGSYYENYVHTDIDDIVMQHFTKCVDCGKWEADGELRNTYQGDDVCRRCIERNYEWSDFYENYVHTDYSAQALDRDGEEIVIHNEDERFRWDDDEEMYVHHEYGGTILGDYHSSKASFRPIESPWTHANCFYIGKPLTRNDWGARKYQRFFGVELEIEAKQRNPRDYAEHLNMHINRGEKGYRCFFERDGSLSNGFEIVTQPMGLDTHTEFWKWLQDNALTKGLLSHNTSTCGLHVHVTKAGLTKMQLSKVVTFINHPDNQDLIKAIARRYDSSYARLSNKKVATAHRDQDSRYEAVNMEPRNTVEFRLFKGTLKYESMMSAIEFTNALLNFCHDQSGYGFDLTTKSFMEYIEKPVIAHDTKHLRPYLANKLESQ